MNTFHWHITKFKVFGCTAELSPMYLSPQSLFLVCSWWFPCPQSGFQCRGLGSVLWPWRGFPSGDPHTIIWYRSLTLTRYWRTPWIAAALGNVLQVSLFSFQVLWTTWTVNGATLLTLCCIPLADSAGQFKAPNVSWIFGFIIGLSSKAAHRA